MTARYEGKAFQQRYGPWAVIAGGSDGIGAAYASELAARGQNVALVARRPEVLARKAAEVADAHGVETRAISADLTAAGVAARIARETADLDVGLFVYNAGSNKVPARFLDQPVDEAVFLVDRNCRTPLELTHHYAARMQERGRGGLILMSSMACLSGCSYQSVYSATKAFDLILAEGLWHELAPQGVDVLGVLAGATRTESVLPGSDRFADAMDPAEVAAGALDHLGKGPNWIPGDANRTAARGIWPTPRVAVINGMSQATAALYDLEHVAVEGREFHED